MSKLQTGIFSDVLAAMPRPQPEKREFVDVTGSIANPEAWLLEAFGTGPSDAGVPVNELTALGISAVHACVDLISSTIASLPAHVYERTIKNGRQVRNIAFDHPVYDLIHIEPNPDMSSYTLRKLIAVCFLMFSNAYVEIFRDAGNNPTALWPCSPYTTWPFILNQGMTLPAVPWRPFPVVLKPGTMAFKTLSLADDPQQLGRERIIAPDDMIHVPGFSLNGRLGERLVLLARPTLAKGIALGRYGNKFFSNDATPSGIMEISGTDQAIESARQSWQRRHSGGGAHNIAFVKTGTAKFTPVTITPEASQMIQTANLIRAEVAGIWHVPVTMLGDIDKGKANAEQLGVEFLSYCLNPHLEAMKQEFKRKLFPNPDYVGAGRRPAKNNFFVDFDTHKLLRPTAADRQAFYATGFNTGSLSSNDIRELENQNPREDAAGDRYYIPVNVQDSENPVVTPNPGDKAPAPPDTESNDLIPLYSRVFRDAFGRVISRDKPDPKSLQRIFSPVLYAISDQLCQRYNPEFSGGQPLPADLVKFTNDYMGGMAKRSSEWTQERADELALAELKRAIEALSSKSKAIIEVNQ